MARGPTWCVTSRPQPSITYPNAPETRTTFDLSGNTMYIYTKEQKHYQNAPPTRSGEDTPAKRPYLIPNSALAASNSLSSLLTSPCPSPSLALISPPPTPLPSPTSASS